MTVSSEARIRTELPGRYLQHLCKHFGHRRPVTFDERSGHIAFDGGDCRPSAEEGVLTLLVEAPYEAGLERLQDVVARHLVRFAFREELAIGWNRRPG